MATALTFDILARDRASATLNRVGRSAATTGKRFERFKTLAAGAGLAAGVALVKFGKDSIGAFTEAQESQKRLQDAFQRFPKIADTNIGKLRAMDTALQKKTKFDDDAIASGQAMLAQFGVTGKQLEQLTPLIVDYASRTGKDVPRAANDVGKALLGNAKALKNVGISYKSTGDRATDTKNIIGLLRTQVGGFAEKEGTTAAGKAEILKNQFGELQEAVGAKLVPALTRLAEVGLKVVDFVQRNSAVLMPLAGALAAVVGVVKIWTAAQRVLNVVLALNPIGLVVTALAGLAVGLVIAYRKSETFRRIVNTSFRLVRDFVVGVGKAIANAFLTAIEKILSVTAGMVGVFAKLPGKLGAPFRGMKDDINNAIIKIHNLQGAINALHGKTVHITTQTNFIAGTSGGRGGGRRQHGGPVLPGRPYIVGERRPELFVPDQPGRILPRVPAASGANGGGNIVITGDLHFHGVQDVPGLMREITKQAKKGPGWRVKVVPT